jgi:hypothetical protein
MTVLPDTATDVPSLSPSSPSFAYNSSVGVHTDADFVKT